MFSGLLTLRSCCDRCGLDLSASDTGDGAAVFVILILGAVFAPLVLWVAFALDPPAWVQVVIWPLPIFGAAILMLRPLKAALVALQYRTRRS